MKNLTNSTPKIKVNLWNRSALADSLWASVLRRIKRKLTPDSFLDQLRDETLRKINRSITRQTSW